MPDYAHTFMEELGKVVSRYSQRLKEGEEIVIKYFLPSGLEITGGRPKVLAEEMLMIEGDTREKRHTVVIANARAVHVAITIEPSKGAIGFSQK